MPSSTKCTLRYSSRAWSTYARTSLGKYWTMQQHSGRQKQPFLCFVSIDLHSNEHTKKRTANDKHQLHLYVFQKSLTAEPRGYLPIMFQRCEVGPNREVSFKSDSARVNFNTFSNPPTAVSRSDSTRLHSRKGRKHVACVSQLLLWLPALDQTQLSVAEHTAQPWLSFTYTHTKH